MYMYVYSHELYKPQVSCDADSASDLCTLFTSHSVVVRKEGRGLEGMAGEIASNDTIASVLE